MSELRQRPTPWALAPEGFHFEATAEDSLRWRLATEQEADERTCRYPPRLRCGGRVVAALDRGRHVGAERRESWWFYCADHMYGRWIEDGKIMHWRLVQDEDA